MNILQALICAYPQWPDGTFVDVTGQDFVDHLSIGASGWVGAWIAIGLTVIFGLLVYVFPVIMTETDYGLYLYIKLPPKEDVMRSGRKAILK